MVFCRSSVEVHEAYPMSKNNLEHTLPHLVQQIGELGSVASPMRNMVPTASARLM